MEISHGILSPRYGHSQLAVQPSHIDLAKRTHSTDSCKHLVGCEAQRREGGGGDYSAQFAYNGACTTMASNIVKKKSVMSWITLVRGQLSQCSCVTTTTSIRTNGFFITTPTLSDKVGKWNGRWRTRHLFKSSLGKKTSSTAWGKKSDQLGGGRLTVRVEKLSDISD